MITNKDNPILFFCILTRHVWRLFTYQDYLVLTTINQNNSSQRTRRHIVYNPLELCFMYFVRQCLLNAAEILEFILIFSVYGYQTKPQLIYCKTPFFACIKFRAIMKTGFCPHDMFVHPRRASSICQQFNISRASYFRAFTI